MYLRKWQGDWRRGVATSPRLEDIEEALQAVFEDAEAGAHTWLDTKKKANSNKTTT
jgi:hypothetical protein